MVTPATCEICNIQFPRFANLRRHQQKKHPMMELSYAPKRIRNQRKKVKETRGSGNYPCDICGKSFNYRSSLFYHKKIHNNIIDYPCFHCSMKFRNRHSRSLHEQYKHKEPHPHKYKKKDSKVNIKEFLSEDNQKSNSIVRTQVGSKVITQELL